jgi:hypothetical protein
MINTAVMERTLDLLTLEEVQDCLRFVEVMERGQNMSQVEADEWRRRIVARQTFLELNEEAAPV